jgi:hypothetical protein
MNRAITLTSRISLPFFCLGERIQRWMILFRISKRAVGRGVKPVSMF